ncbi:MAG: HD family hydrolase [Candidatus Avispirillum sp.]
MKPSEFLKVVHLAEKLKCNTRHSYTSSGRRESVAEHSWRLSLMAMLVSSEFPEADTDKVIRMCLIHDLGEAFCGDIPSFEKTAEDELREIGEFDAWVASFPEPEKTQWQELLCEMNAMESLEAKIYKALDKLEAVIQHDESDISTWIPLEYELNLVYGNENVQFSDYLKELKAEIDKMTREKLDNAEKDAAKQ